MMRELGYLAVIVALLGIGLNANALTEQQQKMLEQMDQMDQMDRMDFVETNNAARNCIRKRDFACAERQIGIAFKFMTSSRDKEELDSTRQDLSSEKKQYEAELEAARQRQIRIAREQAEAEAARQKQGGFQLGKFAAITTGIAIGGKGMTGTQIVNSLSGAIQDSQEGVEGVSNSRAALQKNYQTGDMGSGSGTSGGGQSLADRNSIGQACKSEGERVHPYNDGQLDPLCQQATFDMCLWRRVIAKDSQEQQGIDQYRAEAMSACQNLKSTANSLRLDANACAACR